MWIVPPASLPRWAAADQLLPVPEAISQRGTPFEWNGLLPLYRELLLKWDRKPFGLPIVGESSVCLFRDDLFSLPEWQDKFRVWHEARRQKTKDPPCLFRAPATWQEFATLAEFFREHHPSGKPGPSLPPLPADSAALDRLYYQVASSFARRAVRPDEPQGPDHQDLVFSFHYDLQTGQPRLATPGFVAALDLLRRLQACRAPGTAAQPEQALIQGQAVLAIADAGWLVEVQKQPALRDKVGAAPVPGSTTYFTPKGEEKVLTEGFNRVPYLGGAGWLAVVPKTAGNPAAAWHLLADLAGPARSGQIALEPRWGGGPTRQEQVLRERWDAFALDGPRSRALKDALNRTVVTSALKNPAYCLRLPEEAGHRAILDAGLRRVLLENAESAPILREVVGKWQELDKQRGAETVRVEYRMSLDLSGK